MRISIAFLLTLRVALAFQLGLDQQPQNPQGRQLPQNQSCPTVLANLIWPGTKDADLIRGGTKMAIKMSVTCTATKNDSPIVDISKLASLPVLLHGTVWQQNQSAEKPAYRLVSSEWEVYHFKNFKSIRNGDSYNVSFDLLQDPDPGATRQTLWQRHPALYGNKTVLVAGFSRIADGNTALTGTPLDGMNGFGITYNLDTTAEVPSNVAGVEAIASALGLAHFLPPPPPPDGVPGVSVSPTTAKLSPGESQQFTANGGLVTWSVIGPGAIDQAGLYTAPPDFASFGDLTKAVIIKAASTTNPSQSGTATVTLFPPIPYFYTHAVVTGPSLPFDLAISFTASEGAQPKDASKPGGSQNAGCSSLIFGGSCTSAAHTVRSYDREYWDVGIGIPIPGVREPEYQPSNLAVGVQPVRHADVNAMANFYPFGRWGDKNSYIPGFVAGVPVTGKVFSRPFFGVSENFTGPRWFRGLPLQLSFFAGLVWLNQQIVQEVPHQGLAVEHSRTWKPIYGIEVPVAALVSKIASLGKSASSSSSSSNPAGAGPKSK